MMLGHLPLLQSRTSLDTLTGKSKKVTVGGLIPGFASFLIDARKHRILNKFVCKFVVQIDEIYQFNLGLKFILKITFDGTHLEETTYLYSLPIFIFN